MPSVKRLARRADRRRPDGSRGWRARRAWRALTGAAERGDEFAIEAVWQSWLREPADELWPYVSRWRTLADVLAAAVDPGRSAESRAALGAFCLHHDQVPDNDVARALFFVLTGEHERYEALDPDGTLVSSGYRGASEATREVLRHTMLGLGAVDMVRVIADRPDRELTEAEGDYLVSQLAGAGDWDGLWRLLPTVPLAGAVRAAKEFGDWRPADELGRAFLNRLAAVNPEVVSAVAAAAVTRLEIRHPRQFSFEPDGSELAVRDHKGTTILDPRTGRQLATYPERGQFDMLALGDRTIVYTRWRGNDWSVVQSAPERPAEVLVADRPSMKIGRTPGGFVVSYDRILAFGTASGSWPRSESIGARHLGANRTPFGLVASDPASGRVLLRTGGPDPGLVLLDAELTVLARVPHTGRQDGVFCGPELLLQWWLGVSSAIESWQRDGTTLVRTARTSVDDIFIYPVPLPARNLVVVRLHRDRLTWLDAYTLAEADAPAGLPADARNVAFSQDGALAAIAHDGGAAEVHDLGLWQLTELTNRSVARLTFADLETVETQAARPLTPQGTEVVELLRAGLAYRFGADVALGSWAAGGADDIALGGG